MMHNIKKNEFFVEHFSNESCELRHFIQKWFIGRKEKKRIDMTDIIKYALNTKRACH